MDFPFHFYLLVGVRGLILLDKVKHKKSLVLAGVVTVLGFGILIWLGVWQLERLEWKQAILAKIETNIAMAPAGLLEISLTKNSEYRKVCATGKFYHEKEMYLFTTSLMGEGGYYVYTPFLTENADLLIINRGWVPPAKKNPVKRQISNLSEVQQLCGLIRLDGSHRRFAPENDPAKGDWFYRDKQAMGQAVGLDMPVITFIDADNTPNPGGFPVGGQTRINIPNNHLGYAITWFGLALALAGVFTAYVISGLKK